MADVSRDGTSAHRGHATDPRDRRVRAELDIASSLEGDEPLVWHPEGVPVVRRSDATHALVVRGQNATRVLIGPATGGSDGRTHREVVVAGWRFVVATQPERLAELRERAASGRGSASGGGRVEVRAVIPGRIVAVAVAIGDQVEPGQQILTVEAMKMQNEVRAPHAGRVERIEVAPGQAVEVGTVLVVIG